MDRKEIEAFEKAHHYILPESYINFLLICDNQPEKYCKGYRDIILYSLEELPEERKLYEMDEFCPEYIAIGYGGGGEVLIMKQERDTNTLIVSSGGALLWVAQRCLRQSQVLLVQSRLLRARKISNFQIVKNCKYLLFRRLYAMKR